MSKRLVITVLGILSFALLFWTAARAAQFPINDYNVGETFYPTYRNFVNNALTTVNGLNSGAGAPSNPTPWSLWANTSNSQLEQYNGNTGQFTILGTLGGPFTPPGAALIAIPNDLTTGTTLHTLTKFTPAGAVSSVATTDIAAIGVTIFNAGTSGVGTVQLSGDAPCVFDGATTAHDYVIPSTTTAGDCHDGGSSYVTGAVGTVGTTNASAGTYTINIFGSSYGNATSITAVGPISIMGTQTSGADSIYHTNWNLVFDASTFGCQQDYKKDSAIVVTSGSNTITGSGLWLPTDCTGGSGCTGTVNKAIRIEDVDDSSLNGDGVVIYTGTIASYISPSSVTISGTAPTVTNTDPFRGEWGTPDDACLAAMRTFVGGTSTPAGISVKFAKPVIQTQEWNLGEASGVIEGSGCGSTSTGPGSPIIWFGTTPDVPQTFVQGYGLTFRNMCWVGNSLYPPFTAVMFSQAGASNVTQENAIRDSNIGPDETIGAGNNLPNDTGSGATTTLTSNITAGDTSMAIASGDQYIGPKEILEIVDQVAGNEVVVTSSTYVRGSSLTVTFNSLYLPRLNHTTANALIILPIAPYTYGFTDGAFSGTQADLNNFSNVAIANTDACDAIGSQAGDGATLNSVNCETSVIGHVLFGGNGLSINGTSDQGVAIGYVQLGTGTVGASNDSHQNGGTHAAFGPNFVFGSTGAPVAANGAGLKLLVEDASFSTFIGTALAFDVSSIINTEGDEIETISGVPTIHINGAYLVDDSDGDSPNGTPAIIHRINPTASDVEVSYRTNNPSRHLGVIESGTASQCRHYEIHRNPGYVGEVPDGLDDTFCTTALYNDSLAARQTFYGSSHLVGVPSVSSLATPLGTGYVSTAGVGGTSPPCNFVSPASGSGTDYFYISINGVTDSSGTEHFGPIPATAEHMYCTASSGPTSGNPVNLTVDSEPGMDTINVYRTAACNWTSTDTCTAPATTTACGSGGFCLDLTARVDSSPSGAFNSNTVQDVGAALTATSVPTGNSTGQLLLAGAAQLVMGSTTVANLPTCNNTTELYAWLTVTNNSATCAYNGTPTAGGTNVCPVFCNGSVWLIH